MNHQLDCIRDETRSCISSSSVFVSQAIYLLKEVTIGVNPSNRDLTIHINSCNF